MASRCGACSQKIAERKLLQFKNCTVLRENSFVREDVWVRNGKIVDPEKLFFEEKTFADEQIDCKGALIAPGLIDLQVNGGFGVDFSFNVSDVEKGIAVVAKGILAHGVTAFCPTIVTSPPHVYRAVLPHMKKRTGGESGAAILGVHLEGPFISPSKKGAHPEQYICDFSKGFETLLEIYGSLDDVSIVTLAPEIEHSSEVTQELVRRGITVSVGHSVANLHQGEVAVKEGASFITHLFNAMLPFHHRDPGLVGLLTSSVIPKGRIVFYGIITDGVHTHPAALRIAHRTHPEGLVIVTDAIAALGLENGEYQLGQLSIEVKNSCAYVSGTDTLCGSMTNMLDCVRFFQEATSCSIVEALEAASLHPAQALGISKVKGTLEYGADADFILLGEGLDLWSTWIAGKCVYHAEGKPQVVTKHVSKT